jgi:hypothetical protein
MQLFSLTSFNIQFLKCNDSLTSKGNGSNNVAIHACLDFLWHEVEKQLADVIFCVK